MSFLLLFQNSLVVTISAFDQDVGNPNEIQYTIVSGTYCAYWQLYAITYMEDIFKWKL